MTEPFQVKTIIIKECYNCRSTWVSEKVTLEAGDNVNLTGKIRIAYCPACADDFAPEAQRSVYDGRSAYERRGKRKRVQ